MDFSRQTPLKCCSLALKNWPFSSDPFSRALSSSLFFISTGKPASFHLLQPPAGGAEWGRQKRKRGPQTRGRARGSTWWKRERREREEEKRTGDRLHPLVPLSYWPKACPAPEANGDITVWNAAGEGGANAASCHPGNRSSPVHVRVPILAISRSFIPFLCLSSNPLFPLFLKTQLVTIILSLLPPKQTNFLASSFYFHPVRMSFHHLSSLFFFFFWLLFSSSHPLPAFSGVHREWIGCVPT